MKKAKFIVFEGIDGSGKSTISNMLFEKINSHTGNIYKTFEPTDSPIGSVIKNILKMIMDKEPNNFSFNKPIKYQDSAPKKKWHKFHLLLKNDEYEYFIDLRKFFKMSVSAIVSFAVKKYYKVMMKLKKTDNYPFKNYIIQKRIINNVITWKIYWGYPKKMEKILETQQYINIE